VFIIQDYGLTTGLCKTLTTSATAAGGSIMGQEVAKDAYGNDTTASEFEQGVMTGSFSGSVAGNGVGSALSRTLRAELVPGWNKLIKPDYLPKLKMVMSRALPHIISTLMKDLNVPVARAQGFAQHLSEALRFIDHTRSTDALARI
jgi:hypothetical protein